MSAASGKIPTIADVMARVPGKVNPRTRLIFGLILAVGLVVFVLTLVSNPQRAWSAMVHGLTYWLVLSQAGVVVAGVMILTKAKWGTPMQRILLGAGSFLPWAYGALVLTVILGQRWIFPWIQNPVPQKAAYLNVPFLLVREIGVVGVCTWLSMVFMNRIRRLDSGLARGRVADGLRARYEKWSANWKGDALELASGQRDIKILAGILIPVYAVVYTLVCWDLVMSLDPEWATTMLGAWFFMGGILMGWALLSVLSLTLRRAYHLEDWLTPDRYHQLGKLIFAFSIFWTYLFWSMFLPIWYANMPEETHWIVRRMREPFLPWSVAAITLTWFVPFSGFMNLAAKKNPNTHMFFALVVLTGLWIERLVLVYPSVYHTTFPVGLPEIGVSLAFLGGFALCFQQYAATRPLIALDQLDQMADTHEILPAPETA